MEINCVSLETREEIMTKGRERVNCETEECSSDAIGGPVGEKLRLGFGKGEDGRQTDKGLNEAATEKREANWKHLKEPGK